VFGKPFFRKEVKAWESEKLEKEGYRTTKQKFFVYPNILNTSPPEYKPLW
jgi:hypothetical protein